MTDGRVDVNQLFACSLDRSDEDSPSEKEIEFGVEEFDPSNTF